MRARRITTWALLLLAAGALADGCGGLGPGPTATPPDVVTGALDPALIQARAAAARGEVEAALAGYADAARRDDGVQLLSERSAYLVELGRADQAVRLVGDRYVQTPIDPLVMTAYVDALLASGDAAAALDVCDRLAQVRPGDVQVARRAGTAMLAVGLTAAGLTRLREAARAAEADVEVALALGVGLADVGEHDEALRELRRAERLAPGDVRVPRAIGAALRRQGLTRDAQVAFERALAIDPDDGETWFELGVLANHLGHQDVAEAALRRAAERCSGNARIWYALGEVLRFVGAAPGAEAAYREALSLSPPHPRALTKLSALLIAGGRAVEAEALARGHVVAHPSELISWLALGDALRAQAQWAPATEAYLTYLARAPEAAADRERAQAGIDAARRQEAP